MVAGHLHQPEPQYTDTRYPEKFLRQRPVNHRRRGGGVDTLKNFVRGRPEGAFCSSGSGEPGAAVAPGYTRSPRRGFHMFTWPPGRASVSSAGGERSVNPAA